MEERQILELLHPCFYTFLPLKTGQKPIWADFVKLHWALYCISARTNSRTSENSLPPHLPKLSDYDGTKLIEVKYYTQLWIGNVRACLSSSHPWKVVLVDTVTGLKKVVDHPLDANLVIQAISNYGITTTTLPMGAEKPQAEIRELYTAIVQQSLPHERQTPTVAASSANFRTQSSSVRPQSFNLPISSERGDNYGVRFGTASGFPQSSRIAAIHSSSFSVPPQNYPRNIASRAVYSMENNGRRGSTNVPDFIPYNYVPQKTTQISHTEYWRRRRQMTLRFHSPPRTNRVPDSENCSLYLRHVHPQAHISEYISEITTGKISKFLIFSRSATGILTFTTRASAEAFFSRCDITPGIVVRGVRLISKWNHHPVGPLNDFYDVSRIIKVTGPRDSLTLQWIYDIMPTGFTYNVLNASEWDRTRDRRSIRLEFASYTDESQTVLNCIRRHIKENKLPGYYVEFLADPCDGANIAESKQY